MHADQKNENDEEEKDREDSPEAYSRRHSPAGVSRATSRWGSPRAQSPTDTAPAALGFTIGTQAVAKAAAIVAVAPAVAKPVNVFFAEQAKLQEDTLFGSIEYRFP